MFSPDFLFYFFTITGLGYLFLYVVASSHLEDVLSRSVSFFATKQIVQENVGIAIRFFYDLPTYYAVSEEFEALGLLRMNATESNILDAFEQRREAMLAAPWAYPPSQHSALRQLTVNARVLAKCIALCNKYNREFNRDEFAGALA